MSELIMRLRRLIARLGFLDLNISLAARLPSIGLEIWDVSFVGPNGQGGRVRNSVLDSVPHCGVWNRGFETERPSNTCIEQLWPVWVIISSAATPVDDECHHDRRLQLIRKMNYFSRWGRHIFGVLSLA